MAKKIVIVASILIIAVLGYFKYKIMLIQRSIDQMSGQEQVELANPASVYCKKEGGTLEMRTDEGGQYGVCMFDDGSECEEWALYRKECSKGAK